ncbi:MAG TPA: ORF6N domain-containing protein, partial [Flavobacteriales bacterium]|nr:ORF6N domain-containing protein [Flavobacteriales bacterium]
MSAIKKNILVVSDEVVIGRIRTVRGHKVMLDRDQAELYGVETKRLKEAVRRNKERFPEDFMFEMNAQELENWRSHGSALRTV